MLLPADLVRDVYWFPAVFLVVGALVVTAVGVGLHAYGERLDAARAHVDAPARPGTGAAYDAGSDAALPRAVAEYARIPAQRWIAIGLAVLVVLAVVTAVLTWRLRS